MPRLDYICEGFLQEGGGEEGCQTSPPSHSGNFTVPQDGIVIGERLVFCVYVMGGFMPMFFWFSVVWGIVVPSDSLFDGATHLCFGDISVDLRTAPSALMMHLKSSKTDPFRRGASLVIGTGSGEFCPVAAVLSYMVLQGPVPVPFPILVMGLS